MTTPIPPLATIQARLEQLSGPQILVLAHSSGVPFSTLNKVRYNITKNPGYETVRAMYPELVAMTDDTPAEQTEAE